MTAICAIADGQLPPATHRALSMESMIDYRVATKAAKALKLLGLDHRILAKAVAGDLVPRKRPIDEPVETLLARIRAARATSLRSKRCRLW